MLNHGVNVISSAATAGQTLTSGGLPLFVGCWPCHAGEGYKSMAPQLVHSFQEAVKLGGYSDEWVNGSNAPKWTLCEAASGYFKEMNAPPAIFVNVYNPSVHKSSDSSASVTVSDHVALLPYDTIIDGLSVKSSTDATMSKGTDYDVYYDGGHLVVELLSGGSYYSAATIKYSGYAADLSGVTATTVISALSSVDRCKTVIGQAPDLIAAPGWSFNPTVAAAIAAKAEGINGLFGAKGVVDLEGETAGASSFSAFASYRDSATEFNDKNLVVCWLFPVIGGKRYNPSVIVCAAMAKQAAESGGVPHLSPSNIALSNMEKVVNHSGTSILLSLQEADTVTYTYGTVTFINWDGFRTWGNYLGAGRGTAAPDAFICQSRMKDFLKRKFVEMAWNYIDRELTRPIIDALVNEFNTYLAGLASMGYIYGGSCQYVPDANPSADLLAGKFQLDSSFASPAPCERIDLSLVWDASIALTALEG